MLKKIKHSISSSKVTSKYNLNFHLSYINEFNFNNSIDNNNSNDNNDNNDNDTYFLHWKFTNSKKGIIMCSLSKDSSSLILENNIDLDVSFTLIGGKLHKEKLLKLYLQDSNNHNLGSVYVKLSSMVSVSPELDITCKLSTKKQKKETNFPILHMTCMSKLLSVNGKRILSSTSQISNSDPSMDINHTSDYFEDPSNVDDINAFISEIDDSESNPAMSSSADDIKPLNKRKVSNFRATFPDRIPKINISQHKNSNNSIENEDYSISSDSNSEEDSFRLNLKSVKKLSFEEISKRSNQLSPRKKDLKKVISGKLPKFLQSKAAHVKEILPDKTTITRTDNLSQINGILKNEIPTLIKERDEKQKELNREIYKHKLMVEIIDQKLGIIRDQNPLKMTCISKFHSNFHLLLSFVFVCLMGISIYHIF